MLCVSDWRVAHFVKKNSKKCTEPFYSGKILKLKRKKKGPLRVLVTAGPTRAYFDKVRYLSNYSTGELGFKIAQAFLRKRIEVFVVTGPTHQPFSGLPLKGLVQIETAAEMSKAVKLACKGFKPHFAVFSAAVLDFQPKKVLAGKVSSKNQDWVVRLVPTPKIIDEVGMQFPKIKRIGFKLEWDSKRGRNLQEFAMDLIEKKALTAVCVNFLSQIRTDSHPCWLFEKDKKAKKLRNKKEIATALADLVVRFSRSESQKN